MRAARCLPAVVWDMGGVLYRYFTEVLLSEAAARGWELDGVPMGPTGPVPDEAYAAMDRGAIDEPEYVEVVRGRLAAAGVEADPVAVMDWPREFREAVMEVVAALHQRGHPQAALTNDASRWLGEGWWETWPPAGWFDAIVDVATLEVRKPDPEAYLATAGRLGLEPGDCVFVDDLTVNCEGAEAVGMASVRFDPTAPEASLTDLLERVGAGDRILPR